MIDMRPGRWVSVMTDVAALAAVAVVVTACSASGGAEPQPGHVGGARPAAHPVAATHVQSEAVSLVGKIDADSGAPGTFTGMDGWPALAPSEIHVHAGAWVTLTIREYDDMVTPLPDYSPWNDVLGGTETVDGKAVRRVANDKIAHTITIPSLGINIPLPIAPDGGYTTVTFRFKAPRPGSYLWECVTPCGGDPFGIGGAMHTYSWMRGHLVVT